MMKRSLSAVAAWAVLAFGAAAQPADYETLMVKAQAAFAAEDWRGLAEALDAAQVLRPYSQVVARNRALAYAMLDEFESAIAIPAEYAEHGLSLRLSGHPGFDALKAQAAFAEVAAKMEANTAPRGESSVVFEIEDDGLLPETYAETADGAAFVGSVRTGEIVTRDRAVFAAAPGGVYALAVDGETLWATVNASPPYANAADNGVAAIYGFSLSTGETVAEAAVTVESAALLGALAVTPQGLVASDSGTPRLFLLRPGADHLDLLVTDERFANLQGLAYDAARKKLFVADYLVGLFWVDLGSGEVSALNNRAGAHLGSIDGLALHRGDLIAVQNGVTPQRVVRLSLDRRGRAVKSACVLVQNHPLWREPTNGVVVDEVFRYVAASNWPAYGADGAVDDGVERAPVRVMEVEARCPAD